MRKPRLLILASCIYFAPAYAFAFHCQSEAPLEHRYDKFKSNVKDDISYIIKSIAETPTEDLDATTKRSLKLIFNNHPLEDKDDITLTIIAFYCSTLQKSEQLSDQEKSNRWKLFAVSAMSALWDQKKSTPQKTGQSKSIPTPGSSPPRKTEPPTPALVDVDMILARLPKGSAVVIAPKEAIQYVDFEVLLRLAHQDYEKFLRETELNLPEGSSAKGISGVRMSPIMAAELTGANFIIENNKELLQAVTLNEDTTWSWRVRSENPGTHNLTAKLHTMLSIDGKDTPRTINISNASISVKINPSEFIQRKWEWLVTAIVLPIIGWSLRKFLISK